MMDEIERDFQQHFAPMEQNFKNMEVGLSWLWKKIKALLMLIINPLAKGLEWLIGIEDEKDEKWI